MSQGAQNILQVTDCHLVETGGRLLNVDTQQTLEAVLEQAVAQHPPDAIVATGDLAHKAQEAVYRRFCRTVRRYSDAPLLCLAGNHDILAPMRAAQLPMQSIDVGNWSIVPLDSHQDDTQPSLITALDREAVLQAITQARENVLLATHHPPIKIECPWLDPDHISDAPALLNQFQAAATAVRKTVRALIFGHAHQVLASQVSELPVWGTPSSCFQFLPQSQRFQLDRLAPGWRWLTVDADGGIETRVERAQGVQLNPIQPTLE